MPGPQATTTPGDDHRLAVSLQGALSVDEIERTYLRHVPEVLFARANGLYRLNPATGSALSIAADACEEFLEEYEEYGRADDPVLLRAQEGGQAVDSSRVGGRSVWERSAAYQCLDRAGYYHSMEAPVLVTGIPCATLNFARHADDPPFSSAELYAAQRLSDHISLALERAIRYEETGRRATLLEDALDRVPQAIVVTDLDGNVIFSNRVATNGSSAGDTAMSKTAHEAIVEAMTSFRRDSKRVNVTTVSASNDPATRMIVKSIRLSDRCQASLSLFYPYTEDQAHLPVWELLSPREQEIAELVSRGLTTKEIAARAFVTENTVKQHLKRIFAKTDARNRAELMQRIWTVGSGGPRGSAGA